MPRLLIAACLLSLVVVTPAAQPRRNVLLITLDGARVEEMFGGLDRGVLASTLDADQSVEASPVYRRYWARTPDERREKLMPFFWGTLMREHGFIAGNPALDSVVRMSNRHRFSYPGYAEILLGEAHDDRIASNAAVQNPFPTVLEFLHGELGRAPGEAALFASWSVFNSIGESKAGTLTINAGFEPFVHPDVDVQRLSALQMDTPTPWNSVRHDVYTFRFAMAHLRTHRPQVMYLSLGETDDWAHDGRYDRVLEAFTRSDRYLEELWNWLQSQPEYRDQTRLVITTDHGRGQTTGDWRDHGERVPGAERTWMAFVSPESTQRGEWSGHAPITAAQVATTMVEMMGFEWREFNPDAAPPVELPARAQQ